MTCLECEDFENKTDIVIARGLLSLHKKCEIRGSEFLFGFRLIVIKIEWIELEILQIAFRVAEFAVVEIEEFKRQEALWVSDIFA